MLLPVRRIERRSHITWSCRKVFKSATRWVLPMCIDYSLQLAWRLTSIRGSARYDVHPCTVYDDGLAPVWEKLHQIDRHNWKEVIYRKVIPLWHKCGTRQEPRSCNGLQHAAAHIFLQNFSTFIFARETRKALICFCFLTWSTKRENFLSFFVEQKKKDTVDIWCWSWSRFSFLWFIERSKRDSFIQLPRKKLYACCLLRYIYLFWKAKCARGWISSETGIKRTKTSND